MVCSCLGEGLRFPLSLGRAHAWTVGDVRVLQSEQREALLLEDCIDLYKEQARSCDFILDKEASVVTPCSLREAP